MTRTSIQDLIGCCSVLLPAKDFVLFVCLLKVLIFLETLMHVCILLITINKGVKYGVVATTT